MSENNSSSSGISTLGLLGVSFVVLKLTHVIDWSWWWVLLPFYGGLAILVAILLLAGMGIGASSVISSYRNKKRLEKRLRKNIDNIKTQSRWQKRMEDFNNKKL